MADSNSAITHRSHREYRDILKCSHLKVVGDRISVEENRTDLKSMMTEFLRYSDSFKRKRSLVKKLDEFLESPSFFKSAIIGFLEFSNAPVDKKTSREIDDFFKERTSFSAPQITGGGRLHKALHKGLHKNLHKSLHKGLHKGLHKSAFIGGTSAATNDGLIWPTIEVPWREIKRLYDYRAKFKWHKFDEQGLQPPPPIEGRLLEIPALLKFQDDLKKSDEAVRRARIVTEASNDLSAYMLPLGADVTSTSSSTAVMFQTILWLASMIGLQYKEKYDAPRPHVLSPKLVPFIPVPAYSSYPSNHAFQSFLIAEIFARAVPEHPGGAELYRAAEEVAINREWAGLHFSSDTEAGKVLARLCAPVFEIVLQDQIRAVRAEWVGEGIN